MLISCGIAGQDPLDCALAAPWKKTPPRAFPHAVGGCHPGWGKGVLRNRGGNSSYATAGRRLVSGFGCLEVQDPPSQCG